MLCLQAGVQTEIDGSTLDSSGAMKTGWLKENGVWYYLDESGIMKTGWFKVGQYWYYAYGSGALAVTAQQHQTVIK